MFKHLIARPIKLAKLLRSPYGRRLLSERMSAAYHNNVNSGFGVETIDADQLLANVEFEVKLRKFRWHNGNVSMFEQLLVCSLVRQHLRPGQNFLEIGTFNGATAYNVAMNLPDGSRCLTIDLPPDIGIPGSNQTEGDLEIIHSKARSEKVHIGLANVEQIYADSTRFDFSEIDFSAAFIDGGHHLDIVTSDTANVLKHISRPGLVMWHDFYGDNSVTRHLRSLGRELQIKHVHTTNLTFANLE